MTTRFLKLPGVLIPVLAVAALAAPAAHAQRENPTCLAANPESPDPKRTPPEKEGDEKEERPEEKKVTPTPALAFQMKDIDGKPQDLRQYHGNVVLIVNVASECGLTPQYEGLEALFKKYQDRGFVILGFPANNFGSQEPGSNDEIKAFCKKNYGVTFPMFAKVSVKGEDQCALYQYLTDKKADHQQGGAIKWNFAKFLIDRDGRVVDRFAPTTRPHSKKLVAALERQLEAAIPPDSALARQRKEKEKDQPGDGPPKKTPPPESP